MKPPSTPTPHAYQYCPHLLRNKRSLDAGDIVHTNSWNGFAFRGKAPLVVTEHHVVHDPILNPYKSFAQKIFHRLVFLFEKKSFASADRVISISDYIRDKVKSVFGVESEIIYS